MTKTLNEIARETLAKKGLNHLPARVQDTVAFAVDAVLTALGEQGMLAISGTEEMFARAVEAVLDADTIIPDGGDPRGDAETVVRAVLAAARFAPAQCGEAHPFKGGSCVLPVGHEPGHMCAPEPRASTNRERDALRRVWAALGCELDPDDYKPSVRDAIWKQIVEMCAESLAGVTRVHRENEELRKLLGKGER